MLKTLIFVSSHRRHRRVADRLIGAVAANREIRFFAFDRGSVEHPIYTDARVSEVSLGPMRNGMSLERLRALLRTARIIRRATRELHDSDTIVIANTLELAIICWLCGLSRLPTIYDLADIHPLQLAGGLAGRVARSLERRMIERIGLLVVSSPWFYWEYCVGRLRRHPRSVLIENKVEPGPTYDTATPALRHRVAWNGLLRCERSASVLIECLATMPSLQLSLHGDLERLRALGPELLQQRNCSFTGPYDSAAIGGLLAQSGFVWAIDFADGDNSTWLLPNRLYEALSAGIPLIAVDGSATAEVVRRHGIGIVLPDCTADAFRRTMDDCTPANYEALLRNVRALQTTAIRGDEWKRLFQDARRWDELRCLPRQVDVDVVLERDPALIDGWQRRA